MEFSKLSSEYLKRCNIAVPHQFLEDRIFTHPDYPALKSFTDTLTEVGIEFQAAKISEDDLAVIQTPVLMHFVKRSGAGDFLIFNSSKDFINSEEKLKQGWDGVILYVEPSAKIANGLVRNARRAKRIGQLIVCAIPLLFCVISCYMVYAYHGWTLLTYSILSLLGSIVSGFIIVQESGLSSRLIEQICGSNTNSGCEKVINSKKHRLFDVLSIGQISLIYFLTTIFFLLFSNGIVSSASITRLFLVFSIIAIPIVITSVIYQGFVIRSWCKLCLAVASTLVLQTIVFVGEHYGFLLKEGFFTMGLNYSIFLNLLLACVAATPIGLFLKTMIKTKQMLNDASVRALKSARNPKFFLTTLTSSRYSLIETSKDELTIGNKHARNHILIVCNPYCYPCAKAHETLDRIFDRYKADVSITIRFLVPIKDPNNKKVIAANFLITQFKKTATAKQHEVFGSWFNKMELESWKQQWDISESQQYDELLTDHANWCAKLQITSTPTIFVNGFQFTRDYSFDDLELFMPSVIEMENRQVQQAHLS
jgi:protein-disulfide isomerase